LEVITDGIIYQLQFHGGISRVFSEILPRMCEADETLDITLFLTGKNRQELPYNPNIHVFLSPRITRFMKPEKIWRWLVQRLMERWLRSVIGKTEGKIWHSTYYTMPKDWEGKTVVTVHDMVHELFPDLFNNTAAEQFRNKKRQSILSANMVICVSENTRKDLLNLYEINPDKVRVVPNGFNTVFKRTDNPSLKMDTPVHEPFLLYIGSRSQYKNFGQLVEAYVSWKRRNEVNLVVVGDSWSPDEIKNFKERKIYEKIQLFEKANDELLCYLYNKAAAFVYPSLYEGFGIPLVEAMACGCPVVASRIPSTIEVAGNCPIYFAPGKTEELVAALDKVIIEGRNSQRTLDGLKRSKDFSWQITAEKTLEVYKCLNDCK